MDLISPDVLARQDELANAFATAKPYKHLVIDNFLTPEAWATLLEEFPAHESREGIVGDYGRKNTVKGSKQNVRDFRPTFIRVDDLVKSQTFLDWVGAITGIDKLLYDPDYIGGGIHKNFAGPRSRIHIDYNYHPKTKFHRRLNILIYLTPEWKAEYGGGLKVYENGFFPENGTRDIVPCLGNRCVIFETTEESWHGVESIVLPEDQSDLTRKSIALYFYTDDREAELTAPRHSTIYLPDAFPDVMREGHAIQPDDIKDLDGYRRNAARLIKALYGEHQRLYEKLEKYQTDLEQARDTIHDVRRQRDVLSDKIKAAKAKA